MGRLVSEFHPAFIGSLVEDKLAGSRMVKVKVLEQLPDLVGNLDNLKEEVKVGVSTPTGIVKFKVTVSDFIEAEYLGFDTHSMLPPDVVFGERVLVYQEGDSGNYYWEALDTDNHLRQLEHVILAFSNTNPKDRRSKRLTLDNCYVIMVSTRDKYIRMRTNKNDGEPYAYDIKLDTKAGYLKATDDAEKTVDGEYYGNHALLDSTNTLIELRNIDETYYRLDKKDLIEHCVGNRTLTVGGNNSETVVGNNTKTTNGTMTESVKKAATYTFGQTRSTKVTTADSIKTPAFSVDAPVSNFSGLVKMASFTVGAGGRNAKSGFLGTINGSFRVNGQIVSSGDITAPQFHGKCNKCSCPICSGA